MATFDSAIFEIITYAFGSDLFLLYLTQTVYLVIESPRIPWTVGTQIINEMCPNICNFPVHITYSYQRSSPPSGFNLVFSNIKQLFLLSLGFVSPRVTFSPGQTSWPVKLHFVMPLFKHGRGCCYSHFLRTRAIRNIEMHFYETR